jgi:hypothetical protein
MAFALIALMQNATLTIRAWRRCALGGCSDWLWGLYKLMTAPLTLIPLFSPYMTALDTLWMGALWALHGASGEKTLFYSNRMLKIFLSQ